VWEAVDKYLISPFKSKENFNELVSKIKEKISSLAGRSKEETRTSEYDKSKYSNVLRKLGLDPTELKT